MSNGITEGLSNTASREVEEKYCTERAGYHIFSTPNLVLFIEETAIEALAPYLREGQACVGSTIDIKQVAPTLKGQRVWATTTVKEVDRRRIAFDIEVRDDVEVISTGHHERFIVDLDKLADRLAEKASQLT